MEINMNHLPYDQQLVLMFIFIVLYIAIKIVFV